MTVELLDRVHADLLSGDGRVSAALDVLASSLQAAKRELPFMGWELAYRDAAAMRRLVQRLPASAVANMETAKDQTGAVIYLDLRSR